MSRAAGAMAKMFGKKTRVSVVDSPTEELCRVQLEGPDLVGLEVCAGDKIKVHVGDGAMRSYTPSAHDSVRGTLEILVHVHGDSPGSRWAQDLACGAEVRFVGPSRSLDGRVPNGAPWIAFYGDETAVGLAEFILRDRPERTPVFGALELAPINLAVADPLPLDGVTRDGAHGLSLLRHLHEQTEPPGDGIVFLSGEAGAVLQLRSALLASGIPRERLRIKPYWSVRGKAHRKKLEKTLLRA